MGMYLHLKVGNNVDQITYRHDRIIILVLENQNVNIDLSKFVNLMSLRVYRCQVELDVSSLKKLTELKVYNSKPINGSEKIEHLKITPLDNGVIEEDLNLPLDIEEFDISHNKTIKKINGHFKLKKLNINCSAVCELGHFPNLEYLDMICAYKMRDNIHHLKSLKTLRVRTCGIPKVLTHFRGLENLIYLDMLRTHQVKDISNLTNLVKLNISGDNNVTDFSKLINLKELNMRDYNHTVDLSKLKNLKKLNVSGTCKTYNLSSLDNLLILDSDGNKNISNKPKKASENEWKMNFEQSNEETDSITVEEKEETDNDSITDEYDDVSEKEEEQEKMEEKKCVCDTLDLNKKGNSLSKVDPTKIKTLILNDSRERTIDLSQFTNLTSLRASHCHTELDLSSLTNLTEADIDWSYKQVTFGGKLIKLKRLVLSGPDNKTTEADINLPNMLELEELDIHYNKSIKKIGYHPKLKKINMTCTDICELGNLPSLEHLNMHCTHKMRDNIHHLKSLKILEVGIFGFEQVLTHFRGLENLKCLVMTSASNITDISYLVNLTKLDISDDYHNNDNNVKDLSKLVNLRELKMRNYQHEVDFSHLKNLEKLDISGEKCKVRNLLGLFNLKIIDCDENPYKLVNEPKGVVHKKWKMNLNSE